MTGTTLERMTEVPDNLQLLDQQLATEARTVLGYQHAEREQRTATAQERLFAQLLQLGVPAFTPEAVERYKNRMERRKWGQMFAWMSPTLLFAWAVYYIVNHTTSTFTPAMAVVGLICLGLAFFFIPIFSIQPANWKWTTWSIENYTRPIPSHVLMTALMIRKALPHTSMQVEEFNLQRTEVMDPFLVVTLDNARAYVEVWDEPSFKP